MQISYLNSNLFCSIKMEEIKDCYIDVDVDIDSGGEEIGGKYSNTLKIPHLKIAHLGGNFEVGNVDIQGYQDCPPQLCVVFCAHS